MLLREVLAENRHATGLAKQARHAAGDGAGRAHQRQRRRHARAADTTALANALRGAATEIAYRGPTHELDAATIAFLVGHDQEPDFLDAAEQITADWAGRVTLRLLGPLAPYDFVSSLT